MTVNLVCASTTLLVVCTIWAEGHVDSDGYETYTWASTRQVINSYKVHSSALKWEDATKICNGEGAHLVVPDTPDEFKVLALLFKKLPATSMERQFHLGITDMVDSRVWTAVWESPSESISSIPRHELFGKNCAIFREGSKEMSSSACKSFDSPFVCEKEISTDRCGLDPRLSI